MSYTPTNWVTGNTITATKLNKMEQGIADAGGGASGLCTVTNDTMDKSYSDLLTLLSAGVIPFYIHNPDASGNVVLRLQLCYEEDGSYYAIFGAMSADPTDPYIFIFIGVGINSNLALD